PAARLPPPRRRPGSEAAGGVRPEGDRGSRHLRSGGGPRDHGIDRPEPSPSGPADPPRRAGARLSGPRPPASGGGGGGLVRPHVDPGALADAAGGARREMLEPLSGCPPCRAAAFEDDPAAVFGLLALRPVPVAVLDAVSREVAARVDREEAPGAG